MNKKFTRILSGLAVLSTVLAVPLSAKADLVVAKTPWEKPTFVYGAGLNSQDVLTTANQLGIAGQDLLEMNIDSNDIQRYIGKTVSDKGMISSALVTKLKDGEGVTVEIKTPENITQISEVHYANAAITAGVEDIRIDVAAIRPVTGNSALTGVYKALEANGVLLDNDRMEVAQDELETVTDIAKENKSNEKFSIKNFDQLIINIKNELNIYYNNIPDDKKITREDVQKIVDNAIADNKLADVLTQDQINRLVSFFEKYSQTDAIDSQEVISQLKDLSGNIMDKAQEWYGEAKESGLLDQILKAIQDIFAGIANFFKGLLK